MKIPLFSPTRALVSTFAMLLLLAPPIARAQYHAYNVASGADVIMQDYRSPNVPPGIYDAIHEENVTSSDGGSGYFYGGFTHQNPGTLVQYVCWPASGGFAPYSQQIPFFAGTNMVGYAQIGEGSSCAIKGFWPQFTTNLWTREVVRYWQPADGTTHLGYQGMWIKEPVTGNWYHVGTFLYPFAVTGVTGMSGWQENFSGYGGIYIVDHGAGYYHKSGAWQMANVINYTSGHPIAHASLIDGKTATESQVANAALVNNYPISLTMLNQPAQPTFDPILINNATASLLSTQLLVQWTMAPASSPQLGYRVEVFDNSGYTGSPVVSFFDNDPEARGKLVNAAGVATPYVRLTISDIFFNTNAPTLITPTNVAPSAAAVVTGLVPGLAFQYYESPGGDWTVLPDFTSLTPVLSGVVNFPDVTPRRQRTDYGFTYTGYLTVPTTGLYQFTLHSGDGSRLIIDGATVINFDGLHDSSQFMSGGLALAAGPHVFNLQYFKGAANRVNSTAYTDGLGLAWEGPGLAKTDVPAQAFSRLPGANEPAITLLAPTNGAVVPCGNPGLSAAVTANGSTVNHVSYYFTDFYSYYPRPAHGVDYYLGQAASAPFALNTMVWTAGTNLVRARLVYNTSNVMDSAAVTVATTNSALGAWNWPPLEMHNYPSGVGVQHNTLTLLGDGMNFLSRQAVGDCTLVARLASLTPNTAGPDGITPDGSWRAGIILRGTTNTTIGQPLGDGTTTRFAALFSSVGGGTYFENDTMRNGNGDANGWSGDLGGGNRWYKLQRTGDQFASSVSLDGVNWTLVNTTNLPGIGTTIYAGVFIHATQSFNPNVHSASFDSFSLTGANIPGPAGVSISPLTNAVVAGLPATFAAAVIGPVPAGYQWQLGGTNLPGATSASYTIPSVSATSAGSYTVVANSVTSAPAFLTVAFPAGSGVWTNLNGGSWAAGQNWSGGLSANGVDAAADFSSLTLATSPLVSLDSARTVGSMVFDDLNPVTKHNWSLSPGAGGSLILAVSSGTPNIAVKSATNLISAPVAGTQGFSKTGTGYLTLSASGTFTGNVSVNAGTLEVQRKSGDTPYVVAPGATLKIGYSTGGGYASTGLTIDGNGAADPSGFYLAGGHNYNASGGINLSLAPTTLHQYGTGLAGLGTFDINGTGLWCQPAASGSVLDSNIQMISLGYGMSLRVDAGANTASGDLTLNGPLNVGNLGLFVRGSGSLLLNQPASSGNTALQLQGGTVICGTNNCLGANAALLISPGANLNLNGFSQTVANTSGAGATSLGGNLVLTISKGSANPSSILTVTGANPLNFGGKLTVTNLGPNALAVGDTFTLFNAPSYAGAFTSLNLPPLPVGMLWDTSQLAVTGSIAIIANGLSIWTGGGADANWSTPGNWGGTLPASGQSLTFQGNVRLANNNNLLAAAGQITFGNGGFSLAGNPLTLQWGWLNLAGNNTWNISSTLAAPQSMVSSNGILTVSGPVNNGGYTLSLDGPGSNSVPGVISGSGGLLKNGAGGAVLSNVNTFTGGTVVNGGLLNLAGNSGASGTLSGPLTVNPGGTVMGTAVNALGYGGSAWVTTLNVAGGTFITTANGDQGWGLTVNLLGGNLTARGTGAHFSAGGGWTINTLATNITATIAGSVILRESNPNNQLVFNTASGTASPDLVVSGAISQNATGYGILKTGPGVMSLTGVNTYSGLTSVSGGTLLVNTPGSLASGSPVVVAAGATLGGSGTINGVVTNYGTLAPGNNGIGRLTINNRLILAGNVLMEISRNGGLPTNDLAQVSGSLVRGGLLTVTNTGTNALIAGDSFKLFSAAAYTGSFTNLILPALTAGLQWNTNLLATSGTLAVSNILCVLTYLAGTNGTVTGSATQTVIYGSSGTAVTAVPASGYAFANWSDGSTANPRTDDTVTSNLQVTANFVALTPPVITSVLMATNPPAFALAGTGGISQNYVLLAASNLPAALWIPLMTNAADTNGFFQFTDPQATNYPQRYYRLQTP